MLLYHILSTTAKVKAEKKSPEKFGAARVEKVAQATFSSFARVCVQPFGHTGPLRSAKTDAPVAGFCELVRGRANGFFALYRFFDSQGPEKFGALNDAFFHCLF